MSMPDWPYLPELAMAAQAERVALEELAVDLAEARRQGLAVELVQQRLGIEQIDLAGPARHEQEDAALRLGREMARPWPPAGSRRRRPRSPGRPSGAGTTAPSSPKPLPACGGTRDGWRIIPTGRARADQGTRRDIGLHRRRVSERGEFLDLRDPIGGTVTMNSLRFSIARAKSTQAAAASAARSLRQ